MANRKRESDQLQLAELSQKAAAWIVGMTPRGLRDTDCPRNQDGSYNARDLVAWIVQRQLPVSADPLLAEGDSAALERYRMAKAKLAELDLEVRKGELIEVGRCRDMLARWAVVIRRMGERLSKRYGNDAALTVNESLSECRTIAESITRE